jgi:hypothetical protein
LWDKETLRTDDGSSVVVVFRQSYYLVVDLHSKTAITVNLVSSCNANCIESSPIELPVLLSIHLGLQIKTGVMKGKEIKVEEIEVSHTLG